MWEALFTCSKVGASGRRSDSFTVEVADSPVVGTVDLVKILLGDDKSSTEDIEMVPFGKERVSSENGAEPIEMVSSGEETLTQPDEDPTFFEKVVTVLPTSISVVL